MDLLALDESVEASLRLYNDIDEAEGSGDTLDIWPHSADGLMGDAVEFGLLIDVPISFRDASLSCARNRSLIFGLISRLVSVTLGLEAVAVWDLLHEIHQCIVQPAFSQTIRCPVARPSAFNTLLSETCAGKYVPRGVFVILCQRLRTKCALAHVDSPFHPELLISGKEDSAYTFARGHYTIGKEIDIGFPGCSPCLRVCPS